jgi:nickel transport protein
MGSMRICRILKRSESLKAVGKALVACLGLLLMASAANAHRVVVFAWVEGDTVFTESKFSGGRKVHEGAILVYDDHTGEKLLEGKTNDEGEFSFKPPRKAALRIVLEAGTGHKGEWIVPEEELSGVEIQEAAAEAPETSQAQKQEKISSGRASTESVPKPAGTALSREDVRKAVEEALDNKLGPVLRMLAESRQRGPSLQDVLGGLGYILGLVGLGTYVHYRKKTKDPSRS